MYLYYAILNSNLTNYRSTPQRPMTCHSTRVLHVESRDLQNAGILREARGE